MFLYADGGWFPYAMPSEHRVYLNCIILDHNFSILKSNLDYYYFTEFRFFDSIAITHCTEIEETQTDGQNHINTLDIDANCEWYSVFGRPYIRNKLMCNQLKKKKKKKETFCFVKEEFGGGCANAVIKRKIHGWDTRKLFLVIMINGLSVVQRLK